MRALHLRVFRSLVWPLDVRCGLRVGSSAKHPIRSDRCARGSRRSTAGRRSKWSALEIVLCAIALGGVAGSQLACAPRATSKGEPARSDAVLPGSNRV